MKCLQKFYENKDKLIDLRPYMISELYTVDIKDKFPKVLQMFRFMHLRHLPVVDKETGEIKGIITRQDLFAYMSI